MFLAEGSPLVAGGHGACRAQLRLVELDATSATRSLMEVAGDYGIMIVVVDPITVHITAQVTCKVLLSQSLCARLGLLSSSGHNGKARGTLKRSATPSSNS